MYGPLSQFSTKESLKFDAHWSVHANKMTLSCDVCSLPLQAKQANTKSSKFISIYIFSVRMSTMNFYRLYKILTDHNGCIEWCKEHNLLASSVKYPRAGCSNALSWTVRSSSRDGYEWRCSKRGCNGMASIRQNSWFSGSKLSIEKILALTYAWAHKFSASQAVHETSLDDETTSTEMVVDWYNYCREVCADRIMNHHAGPIGGPGTTVEIDESKFGKMKYHRGRPIEGKWVFGGICRETKACFLVPVERRDRDTLLPIIRAHILPGTRVMSDLWKAYDCLTKRGLRSSHSKPQPKLRRPRHRCPHTAHRKHMVGSKAKFAPYRNIQRTLRWLPTGVHVASAIWRGSLWKHYQAYRRPL